MKRLFISALYIFLSIALFAQDDINLLDLIKDDSTNIKLASQPISESPAFETSVPEWDWREHRHSLSISIGSPSFVTGMTGFFTALFSKTDSSKDTNVRVFGSYGVHYGYNALRWLRVGGSIFYSGWQLDETSGSRYQHKQTFHELALIGRLDFTYLNRKHVRLYSGLGLGAELIVDDDYSRHTSVNPPSEQNRTCFPSAAFYVTPIGIEAGGKHVYGLAEINIGTTDMLRAGLGVRF